MITTQINVCLRPGGSNNVGVQGSPGGSNNVGVQGSPGSVPTVPAVTNFQPFR